MIFSMIFWMISRGLYANLNLNFLCETFNFLYENLGFSLWKNLMIFSMIFFRIHEVSYYQVRVSMRGVETCLRLQGVAIPNIPV